MGQARFQLRCTDEQRARWEAAAGGPGLLSGWLRVLADRAAGGEAFECAVGTEEEEQLTESERRELAAVQEIRDMHEQADLAINPSREVIEVLSEREHPHYGDELPGVMDDPGSDPETVEGARLIEVPPDPDAPIVVEPKRVWIEQPVDPDVNLQDEIDKTDRLSDLPAYGPVKVAEQAFTDDVPPEPEEPRVTLVEPVLPVVGGGEGVAPSAGERDDSSVRHEPAPGSTSVPLTSTCINAVMHWQLTKGEACRYCKGVA